MQIKKLLAAFAFLLAIFHSTPAMAGDKISIEGTITNEHKEPLPFAIVKIENLPIGVMADWDGNFRLDIDTDMITGNSFNIIFSYLGYEKQVVEIDKRNCKTSLQIVLIAEKQMRYMCCIPRRSKGYLPEYETNVPDYSTNDLLWFNLKYMMGH